MNGDGYVVLYPDSEGFYEPSAEFGSAAAEQSKLLNVNDRDADPFVVLAEADGSLPSGMTIQDIETIVLAKRTGNFGDAIEIADNLGATLLSSDESGRTVELTSSSDIPSTAAKANVRTWAALANAWSPSYEGDTIIGVDWGVKIAYTFTVTEGSNQGAAGRGYGYYRGYNGSVFGTWSQYYNLGSAFSNTATTKAVPWGNVAGKARFKATSLASIYAAGKWNT
ncbi:hypothetical protein GCM10010407_03640 [Rarobacter incanus]